MPDLASESDALRARVRAVFCPTCDAPIHASCTTASGRYAATEHAARRRVITPGPVRGSDGS